MALVKSRNAGGHAAELEQQGAESLIADLSSAEPGVRRRAARALANYQEAAMALVDRLQAETAPSVREVIFTSLIKLQSGEVASRLIGSLRSEETALRNGAIEALQGMPDVIEPFVAQLLKDPDSDVRIFAVTVLGALRHSRAPQWLSDLIETEEHINVCAAAVDALAEIGDASVLGNLKDLRDRFADTPFMSFAIDTAIARIGER